MEIIQKAKDNQFVLKVVVLGDICVGKTNIVRRIMGEDFQETEMTVGVEFGYIDLPEIEPEHPENKIVIQIWDTSGSERYRAITTGHIREADGAFLVYDMTDKLTFDHLDFWFSVLEQATDDTVVYLLGNKADLVQGNPKLKKVSKEQAISFAKMKKFQGFGECSALRNVNIQETFTSFCRSLYKRNKNKLKEKTDKKVFQIEKMQKKQLSSNYACC